MALFTGDRSGGFCLVVINEIDAGRSDCGDKADENDEDDGR